MEELRLQDIWIDTRTHGQTVRVILNAHQNFVCRWYTYSQHSTNPVPL